MNQSRNRQIQKLVSGIFEKTAWSMLWQKKEIHISEVVQKGYSEDKIKKAFFYFVEKGFAVPGEKHGWYKVNENYRGEIC